MVIGPVIPALCLALLLVHGHTPSMATKSAYRAILRELYKGVRILPHLVQFLSHYVF